MYTSPSGKSYIGQTWNENKRKREHQKYGKVGAFANAIRKYGFENMMYTVLHRDITSQENMNILERYEIENNNTLSPNGYNLDSGGAKGKVWSQQSKDLMSKILKGRPGKKMSELSKQKIREARARQIISIESRMKVSEKLLGTKRSSETVLKMKKYHSNRPKEHIKHLLESRRNRRYVRCIETGIIYESCWDAAKSKRSKCKNGSMIIMAINGKCKTAYGYHWEYADERA